MTAVHVLNPDVLPFFEKHQARIHTVLSDNDREFCGQPDRHPYELFLQLEEIEPRTTQIRRPQSNGFVERFHRTLLDEHLRIQGRKKFYENLDTYLVCYKTERSHRGLNMKGTTPAQALPGTDCPRTPKEAPRRPPDSPSLAGILPSDYCHCTASVKAPAFHRRFDCPVCGCSGAFGRRPIA